MAVAGLALLLVIVVVERMYKKVQVSFDDGSEAYIPLKLTPAGVTPTLWVPGLIVLPAIFLSSADNLTLQRISFALSPGEPAYNVVYVIIFAFLYFFFTSVFYNSEKITSALNNKSAIFVVPSNKSAENYMDRTLTVMAIIGLSYLGFLIILPKISVNWGSVPIAIGGVALIKGVAIALDIFEEIRARRKAGSLVKIAEVHDVPTAGLARSLLEGKGLHCHLRGYYHRALLYFFGPYIEISVLVPEEKAAEATEAIGKYVGQEFLVRQPAAD
jgi:preprotein translocase subunit SecY